jgi:ketopantoate reductase
MNILAIHIQPCGSVVKRISIMNTVEANTICTEYPSEQSSSMLIDDAFQNKTEDDHILKMFEQLAAEKVGDRKMDIYEGTTRPSLHIVALP